MYRFDEKQARPSSKLLTLIIGSARIYTGELLLLKRYLYKPKACCTVIFWPRQSSFLSQHCDGIAPSDAIADLSFQKTCKNWIRDIERRRKMNYELKIENAFEANGTIDLQRLVTIAKGIRNIAERNPEKQ